MNAITKKLKDASRAFLSLLGSTREGEGNQQGSTVQIENRMTRDFNSEWVDPTLREAIRAIRDIDKKDSRIKRIHSKVAVDATKDGLILNQTEKSEVVKRQWDVFTRTAGLMNPGKLKSDARGFILSGNLALQWVFSQDGKGVLRGVQMPPETLVANVDSTGQFRDVTKAYRQVDEVLGQRTIAEFARYELSFARIDPDSYDDMGAMGRPFLDASRTVWQQLTMTERDLVIRRRYRAPVRLTHVLEGATNAELETYKASNEKVKGQIATDFYLNRKGGVQSVAGDSSLGDITDVVHLLDTLFSGAPYPKALLGYSGDTSRDVLEDLKRSYYDEIDFIQDEHAALIDEGFRLHLLLNGINPLDAGYTLKFATRRTETPTQAVDRALKLQALGIPDEMCWAEVGYNPAEVLKKREEQRKRGDPYPEGAGGDKPGDVGDGGDGGDNADGAPPNKGRPVLKVTPGNGRKGESATSIGNT